jgi:hypothetical protein
MFSVRWKCWDPSDVYPMLYFNFQTTDLTIRHSNPCGVRDFSLSSNVQTGPGAYLTPYSVGTGDLSMAVRRSGREADHSPPSSAEIKHKWDYTSIPPVCVYGVYRETSRDVHFRCYVTVSDQNVSTLYVKIRLVSCREHCAFFTKTIRLVQYRKITAVYFENRT